MIFENDPFLAGIMGFWHPVRRVGRIPEFFSVNPSGLGRATKRYTSLVSRCSESMSYHARFAVKERNGARKTMNSQKE